MVRMDESRTAWLWPLRRSPSTEKGAIGGDDPWCSKDSERDFDIVDSMEKGLARELVADFMRPLTRSSSPWKLYIERSGDGRQHRLFCDDGEFLMYAEVSNNSRRVDFFLHDPQEADALYDQDRPAFTLSCSASRAEWRLVQERSDGCHLSPGRPRGSGREKREVAFVRHSRRSVGDDGISNRMDVRIPSDEQASARGGCGEHMLVTKMPVWNDELESLVLDFKGQKVLPSASNFQLALEGRTREVICQYGRIGEHSFSLDLRFPLTVIQAFGISMTTLLWT